MPRYKVLQKSYINGQMYEGSSEAGDVFVDYDGNPGTNLEPTDDAGRARQAEYFKSKGVSRAAAAQQMKVLTEGAYDNGTLGGEKAPVTDHVAIPDNWAKLPVDKVIELAGKLGAPVETTTKAEAAEWIQREVERRAKAAA